jgi:hypothetical protein
MKTKTHFAFRVDVWDDAGNSIVAGAARENPAKAIWGECVLRGSGPFITAGEWGAAKRLAVRHLKENPATHDWRRCPLRD